MRHSLSFDCTNPKTWKIQKIEKNEIPAQNQNQRKIQQPILKLEQKCLPEINKIHSSSSDKSLPKSSR